MLSLQGQLQIHSISQCRHASAILCFPHGARYMQSRLRLKQSWRSQSIAAKVTEAAMRKFGAVSNSAKSLGLSISIDRKPCTRPCPSRYPPWAVHHKGCCHLSNDHHASGSSQIQCRDRCSHHPTCRTWTNPRKWSGQDWQVRSQQFFPDSVDIAHLNSAKNRRFWTLWLSKPTHQFSAKGHTR